jgi:hypothetical protein
VFPWFWFWAPQLHLPWSGDVAQRIEPTTSWFFQGIRPEAGDADIEQKAFDVASYGKQLGLLTEVLIDLAEQTGTTTAQGRKSLTRLKQIRDEIERIKQAEFDARARDVEAAIVELSRKGGAEYEAMAKRLLPLLGTTR